MFVSLAQADTPPASPQQKLYESLDRINPFSQSYENPKAHPASQSAANPHFALIEKLLSHPGIQSILRLYSNAKFLAGIEQILKNPNKITILLWEIGWFFFVMFFRAWKLSKLLSSNWLKILWLNFWTSAVYIGIASLIIPWIFLGDAYYQVVSGAYEVLLK
jgi:hypothetical protein